MSNISIVKYNPDFKRELINFLSYIWKNYDFKKRKAVFEWKYEKNPYFSGSLNYLALDEGEIVGHRSFVPHKFRVKHKTYLFGTPADTVVHPDYRRKGIFSKLNDFGMRDIIENEYLSLLVSLSSSKASSAGNIKAGFVPVGTRRWLYYFSKKSILKDIVTTKLGGMDINNSNDENMEISNKIYPKQISQLMEENNDKEKISSVRDEEFYRWRFIESPFNYLCCYLWQNDKLIGYISFKRKTITLGIKKINCLEMMEFAYADIRMLDRLIKNTKNRLSPASIIAYVFTRKNNEISILNRNRFKSSESIVINYLQKQGTLRPNNLPGLLVKPVSPQLKESSYVFEKMDVRNPKNWSLFWSSVH